MALGGCASLSGLHFSHLSIAAEAIHWRLEELMLKLQVQHKGAIHSVLFCSKFTGTLANFYQKKKHCHGVIFKLDYFL